MYTYIYIYICTYTIFTFDDYKRRERGGDVRYANTYWTHPAMNATLERLIVNRLSSDARLDALGVCLHPRDVLWDARKARRTERAFTTSFWNETQYGKERTRSRLMTSDANLAVITEQLQTLFTIARFVQYDHIRRYIIDIDHKLIS